MRLYFDLGLYLKENRLQKHMTQCEVAEKAKIDEKHYGRIERNVCEPRYYTLLEIIKALEIEPGEIIKNSLDL